MEEQNVNNEEINIDEKKEPKEKFTIKKLTEYIPIWCFVVLGITIISFTVSLLYHNNSALADFLNDTFGRGIRFVLTQITNLIPFSLTETLIVGIPIWIFLIFKIIISLSNMSKKKYIRACAAMLAIACIVVTLSTLAFNPSFYNPTIDEKLGFKREKVSAQDLYDTGMIVLEKMTNELDNIVYPLDTYSSMMMTYDEMNAELNKAWDKVNDTYPNIQRMYSKVKPVVLSYLWTYTHISGMYFPMTGEANLNVNYPDYIIVSSAAHEMAHQRGIGREDEANFMAFLVCTSSDNPYLKYAGYLDVFDDILSALAGADPTLYSDLVARRDNRIVQEGRAYGEFFEKYRKNVASNISDKVNDTAIKIRGQETGLKSYGLVVDLVVAYYK